jgi:hypothetical protein
VARKLADSSPRVEFDLDQLLNPAQAFGRPSEVVNDPDLTLNEKRAILASWVSDACAVEAAPALRHHPNGGEPVLFDEVMDALRMLDHEARSREVPRAHYKRRHRFTEVFDRLGRKNRTGSGGGGLGSPSALN